MSGGGGGHVLFPLRQSTPPISHIFLPSLIRNAPHDSSFTGMEPFLVPETPSIQPRPVPPTILKLEEESVVDSPELGFVEYFLDDLRAKPDSKPIETGQVSSVETKLSDQDSTFVSQGKPSTEDLDHESSAESVLKSFKLDHSNQPVSRSEPAERRSYAYNARMKYFSLRGNIEKVLNLFSEMKTLECNPNVLCYNTVINALAKSGREKDAVNLFVEMLQSGISPDIYTFNIFVKLHSFYKKQFDSALNLMKTMNKFGLEPDLTTYSTLIAGLCKSGKIVDACGVLDFMIEQNFKLTVSTVTPLVQAYCSQGKIEEAKTLMATMENSDFPPNIMTYNILINGLCKVGNFDEVEKLLEESQSKGWVPNSVTYNTYMNGLCKFGMYKQALHIFDSMINKGLNPTDITLSILINILCYDSRILEAERLLERSLDLNYEIGLVGYNTLMSRLCEDGKWNIVLKFISKMYKKGIEFNTRTLNIVINSLCSGGKFELPRNLINCRGFVRNVVTYNTLLHWSFLEDNFSETIQLVYKMENDGIAPDGTTYRILVEGYFRKGKYMEAIHLFLESIESGVVRDCDFVLANKLVENRRFVEIMVLLNGMQEKGFCVFDFAIRVFCSSGFCVSSEMYILCHILDKMLVRIFFI